MAKYWDVFRGYQLVGALALSVIAPLTLLGCKGESNSQSKSLNNFARNSGDVARNVCTGNYQMVAGIQAEWDHVDFTRAAEAEVPKLKNALKQSLSAVPSNLQELFFGLGGKIVFSPNLSEPAKSSSDLTCDRSGEKAKFAGEGTSQIEACWTIDPRTSDVVILMNPKEESVHHATVRIFGYILSQVLTKVGVDEKKEVLVPQKDVMFEQLMGDIATAVIADIKRPGSKYTMKVNESLARSEEFKYFAFAESFDSYYCNAALRQTMAKKDEFPQTYALFEHMDRELRKVQVSGNATTDNTDASFSLAGDGEQIGEDGAFDLRFFGGGLFRAIGGAGRFLGGGLLKGVGAIGKGVAGLGRGIFRGGAALVRGGGRVLGGAARGIGALLGGGGGGGIIGNLLPMAQQIMGMIGPPPGK